MSPHLPLPLEAALHKDGRVDEARKIVDDYRPTNPEYRAAHVQRIMVGTEPRYAEGRQRMTDSLQALGMP